MKMRTDATHVLAAVRAINRVVCVGETLAPRLTHWQKSRRNGYAPLFPMSGMNAMPIELESTDAPYGLALK